MISFTRKGDKLVGEVEISLKHWWKNEYLTGDKLANELKEDIKKEFIQNLGNDLYYRIKEDVKEKLAKELLEGFDARKTLDQFYVDKIKGFLDKNERE